jgi:hypothetical protein
MTEARKQATRAGGGRDDVRQQRAQESSQEIAPACGDSDDGVPGGSGVYVSGSLIKWAAMVDSSPHRTGWWRRRWPRRAGPAWRLWAVQCVW